MSHGKSLSLSQNNFIRAPNNEAKDQPPVDDTSFRRQKRQANVYDAVAENNFYFAHEALVSDYPLPSSGLLEAIHAYSANFYDNTMWDWGQDNYQSIDKTALIAMRILLEKMAQESLGKTGDSQRRPAIRNDRRVGL
ncbi:hypothetical protein DTO027B9_1312 [Paecilomyces variotii]|nr:hypothetical protein DTO027B9_1312 [Paecilomyces variotii]